MLYDDQIQLLRAAGVSVVPTIVYIVAGRTAVSENPKLLDADSEVAPFISKEDFASMPGTDTDQSFPSRPRRSRRPRDAVEACARRRDRRDGHRRLAAPDRGAPRA